MALIDGSFQSRGLGVTANCPQAMAQSDLMMKALSSEGIRLNADRCPIVIVSEADANRPMTLTTTGFLFRGANGFSKGTSDRAEMLHRSWSDGLAETMSEVNMFSGAVKEHYEAGLLGKVKKTLAAKALAAATELAYKTWGTGENPAGRTTNVFGVVPQAVLRKNILGCILKLVICAPQDFMVLPCVLLVLTPPSASSLTLILSHMQTKQTQAGGSDSCWRFEKAISDFVAGLSAADVQDGEVQHVLLLLDLHQGVPGAKQVLNYVYATCPAVIALICRPLVRLF
jgi:hypothetical protein